MKSRVWAWFRLAVAVLSLAFAGMIFIPAPTIFLWLIAVAATEYGHWFMLVPLVLGMMMGTWRARLGLAAGLISLAAVVMLLSPAFRAARMAETVKQDVVQAFSSSSDMRFGAPLFDGLGYGWENRQKAQVTRHVYAEHAGQKLHFDFYQPRYSPLRGPVVIMVHSGGWNSGTEKEFPAMNHYLAGEGYAVVAMEYRLAPRWKWPAQKEDVLAVLKHVRENEAALGVAASQCVIMGRSAGGQIAEAVAYGGNDPAIKGCVAFYAPADMHFAFQYADPKDILDSYKLLVDYLGGTPKEVGPNYDDASGYGLVTAKTVPTLLLHGGNDVLVWRKQSERLAARLAENRVPHYYLQLPWAVHACDYNLHGPSGQLSRWTLQRFLEETLYR